MRGAGPLLASIATGKGRTMRRLPHILCGLIVAASASGATLEDAAELMPCNTPEYRQFDFWLGDWDVTSAASPGSVSHNRITSINDGCTLREEYTTPTGYAGSSLNFYDSVRKVWHQTWIDNQGGALYLDGAFNGQSMVLATSTDPQNVQRITWSPLPDGRVRQHWEATTDSGQTWTTVFDGYYEKRKES